MIGRRLSDGQRLMRLVVWRSRPTLLPVQSRSKCKYVLGTSPPFRVPAGSRAPVAVPSVTQQVRFSHLSSIVDRGAYDERFHQRTKGADTKSLRLVSDGKHVEIVWADGKTSRYHSLWLRSTCYCPKCRTGGQSDVDYNKVPEDSRILSAKDDGEGCLVVRWKEDPDHEGLFPLKFLKACCYSKESLEEKKEKMIFSTDTQPEIPRFSYEDILKSKEILYRWVKAVNAPGLAILDGVPDEERFGEQLIEKVFGFVQHTVFGMSYSVKTDPNPNNPAYTSSELKLHMDLPHYEAPPGVQFLHCLKFDETIEGGENMYVDMFHVADVFRQKHPDDFKVLSEVPITFEELDYGGFLLDRQLPVHMAHKTPMLTLNDSGDLVAVRWRPNLLGPLQVEERLIEPFFRAYKKFYSMALTFPYMYRNRLRAGELVAFNNRRMAHGRKAFSMKQGGQRHLRGCYVEICEFKSTLDAMTNLLDVGDS